MYKSETPMDDDAWRSDILSSFPAVMNQSPDSNNQKILGIIANIAVDAKNELLEFSVQSLLSNCSGDYLTELAKEYGVTRIDDDDDFLRFEIRLQWLKGRSGITNNDIKRLIATILDIDIMSFDIVGTDNPLEIRIVNLPFNFTENKQEIKKKILAQAIQEMLPATYLLVEMQFVENIYGKVYVGALGQTHKTAYAMDMTTMRRDVNLPGHLYVAAVGQSYKQTYPVLITDNLKGVM